LNIKVKNLFSHPVRLVRKAKKAMNKMKVNARDENDLMNVKSAPWSKPKPDE
jgi:hypothetical protein